MYKPVSACGSCECGHVCDMCLLIDVIFPSLYQGQRSLYPPTNLAPGTYMYTGCTEVGGQRVTGLPF